MSNLGNVTLNLSSGTRDIKGNVTKQSARYRRELYRAPYGSTWFTSGDGTEEPGVYNLSVEVFNTAGIESAATDVDDLLIDIFDTATMDTPWGEITVSAILSYVKTPMPLGYRLDVSFLSLSAVTPPPVTYTAEGTDTADFSETGAAVIPATGLSGDALIVCANSSSPSAEAQWLSGVMSDLGLTPSYITDSDFVGGYTSATLIVFENSAVATDANPNRSAWLDPGAPVIILDGYMAANGQFDFTAVSDSGSSCDGLKPDNSSHAVWDGITLDGNGNFQILNGTSYTYGSTTGNLASGINPLAQRVRMSDDFIQADPYICYHVPAGTNLGWGTFQEHAFFLGFHVGSFSAGWHSNVETLIKNAAAWLVTL